MKNLQKTPTDNVMPGPAKSRRRVTSPAASVISRAEPALWVTGGSMVMCMVMILGLLGFVFFNGARTFWPVPIVEVTLHDGTKHMGEVTRSSRFEPSAELIADIPAASRKLIDESGGLANRRLIRTGNFRLTGEHFNWVSDFEIAPDGIATPEWAVLLERLTWGRFYGVPAAFRVGEDIVAHTPSETWEQFSNYHQAVRQRYHRRKKLEKDDLGKVNHAMEVMRLQVRDVELKQGKDSPAYREAAAAIVKPMAALQKSYDTLVQEIKALDRENDRFVMTMRTAAGQEADIKIADVVRAYPANRIGIGKKIALYLSRWVEFLTDEPREANSEGGVWPAIFGTVLMTLIMALLVSPVGVLAALYLREYAKAGPLVSTVRIAINNLAGVPSIVFGVFGLGFFCYIMGGTIDQILYAEKLPTPTYGTGGILWASLTLALLTLPVVIVATEEALAAVPNSMREGSYACGASKWQTIKRIVIPRAMPGVMTGMILAMARGAGEVAPLMLVGAVKMAPELPFDGFAPFFHLERSFMHLGFHIYDLGFQSQNSEAAKPMVYTTTFLLITLIFLLNITGIGIRARLKKKFKGSAV
jgi:phosphate transport system permease protein